MRVKLYENAAANYVRRCYRHARPDCGMLHRPEFEAMLRAVQGQWIEIETDYLFRDQFNTAPIPGVSENGLRVMIEDVEQIEDDVRIGKLKCAWCGSCQDSRIGGQTCVKCDRHGHLAPLDPITR